MGFLSKLKHHAKKLIGKQVNSPEEVAERLQIMQKKQKSMLRNL